MSAASPSLAALARSYETHSEARATVARRPPHLDTRRPSVRQAAEVTGIPLRRAHERLRVHAERRRGQRPHSWLLPSHGLDRGDSAVPAAYPLASRAHEQRRSFCCPATGSAPRSSPPTLEVLNAVGTAVRLRGAPVRRRLDRCPRHRPHRRDAGRLPGGRRGAAGRRRRAQVGHDRPVQAPARAGSARIAQGARAVRQPAAGAATAGAVRREPAASAR